MPQLIATFVALLAFLSHFALAGPDDGDSPDAANDEPTYVYFHQHSQEIRDHILSFSSFDDLDRIMRVSRNFRATVLNEEFIRQNQFSWSQSQIVNLPIRLVLRELTEQNLSNFQWRLKAVRMLLNESSQFAHVPSATFLMGSSGNENDINFDPAHMEEEKSHWVHVDSFKMQRIPVTQLLWFLVMGNNPTPFFTGLECPEDAITIRGVLICPRHPVSVSWNQVAEKNDRGNYKLGTFIRTLDIVYGIKVRLPTEAERERANRGNLDDIHFYSPYYFGEAGENNQNLKDNIWFSSDRPDHLHRVAMKGWNSLGLADMNGNIYEWVSDWYGEYPDAPHLEYPLINPTGPAEGTEKVIRGGRFNMFHTILRSAFRFHSKPNKNHGGISVRLILTE